jgi:hypothetical protein
MKTVIMSDLYPCFGTELAKYGYRIIPSKNISAFSKPERSHADMQALRINNVMFSLDDCVKKAGEKYPENILLNCLFLNNTLYGKLDSTDDSVIHYCRNNNIKLVNVNQGYTRCSTLAINNKAAITADKSIEKALKNNGVEVLLIEPGYIKLDGFDYGFIGGASFKIAPDTLAFTGRLTGHPDQNRILCFLASHGIEPVHLTQYPAFDIGSAVPILEN